MRKNPHVRICGGLGSGMALVYPTDRRDRVPRHAKVGNLILSRVLRPARRHRRSSSRVAATAVLGDNGV